MPRKRTQVTRLGNGWWRVVRDGATRHVGPGGLLTMLEAASALGTYYMRLDRMSRAGRLRTVHGPGGYRMVPVVEVSRVLAIGLAAVAKGRP